MSYDMIRRDALLEFARIHIDGKIDCNDIARFPYANAEPVRHGRWIETKTGFRCSVCKKKPGICSTKMGADLSEYCHRCGAKMDGDAYA